MLTKRQRQILNFITSYIKKKRFGPSLEDIKKHFRLRAVSTVHQHVKILKEKGFLKKLPFQPRSIGLYKSEEGLTRIPLLGFISAGKPIEPFGNPEPIKIPISMIKPPGNYYALKVKGNSMIEDGICEGDTVVIKHQVIAESGDTVVAITEKGATLKIFRKKNGKIFLEPRNKRLKSFYPTKLEIKGKLCGLIRK